MYEKLDERLQELEHTLKDDPLKCIEKGNLYLRVVSDDFSIKAYTTLVVEVSKHRNNGDITEKQGINYYKKIYKSQLAVFSKAYKLVEDGMLDVGESIHDIKGNELEMIPYILNFFKGVAEEAKRELYILKKYPKKYYNAIVDIIGNYFESRYTNDSYVYKDTSITRMGFHEYGLRYFGDTIEEDKRVLLNVIAYYYGKPLYRMTDNQHFNSNLDTLYGNFDLYDLITLRHKDYLTKEIYAKSRLCDPVFKIKKYLPLIEVEELAHPQMLDSYHDSLKQFEPLPRCVFLYRVFEYAAAVHYRPTFKPSEYDPRKAIEYYYNEAMNHRFSTLYSVRGYRPRNLDPNNFTIKSIHTNFLNTLKKESKQILEEWSQHNFLKNKSLGSIICDTGRNRVAHGGASNYVLTYDYQGNYLHINNVNIILELIARYTIEVLNPSIYNLTETHKKYYKNYQ